MFSGGLQGNGDWYKTASGERIDDYGLAKFLGVDELGQSRTISGRVSDVHKILASGGRMATAGNQDFYIGADGGYGIPKDSWIGWEMRKHFDMLLNKYGTSALLPIYLENGVFNFYLKKTDIAIKKGTNQKQDLKSLSGNGSRQERSPP